MADSVPPIPPDDADPEVRVPDPHRNKPVPPDEAGTRPEATASNVRPEQDEPGGPLPGLVAAGAAQAAEETTDDDSAEALLAQMGVEDEGIESGQIIGTVAAILVSIVVLIAALIWLIYEPFRENVVGLTESEVRYTELETTRAAGLAQLSDFRTTGDGAYGLPIARAMGVIAAQDNGTDSTAMPTTRAGFNTAWIHVETPPATESRSDRAPLAAPDADAPGALTNRVTTDEAVGVDDPEDVE